MEDSNNILRREYFDWAEDVENEINNELDGYNWSMPIDEFLSNAPESPLDRFYLQKKCSIKECDEDETISQGDMVIPGSPLRRFYLKSSDSIEVLEEADSCLQTDAENSTAMASLATGAGPFIVDRSQRNEDLQEDSRDRLDTVNDIREVFGWRHRCVLYNPETHHFNWFNEPVYTRSGTPPSVSLVIIHAEPKTPEVKENYGVMSTLHRALGFIDPVVVDLAGADDNLLNLRGSQLQQAATGRTHRYYSRHGRWMDDPDEDPDIDVDIGSIDHFYGSNLAVGNGFTRSVIRTASEWLTARQKIRTSRSKSCLPKTRGCLPSPLRQMWLASEVNSEIKRKALSEGSQQLVGSISNKRVQRPLRRNRTPRTDAIFTDPSRDPNIHN
jgi:hypothetical protein